MKIYNRYTDKLILEVEDPKKDLRGANLRGARLSGANLSGADLFEANLFEANLFRANLFRANLSESILFRARLSGANLRKARLSGADLKDATLPDFQIPNGDLIVWKKLSEGKIAKLLIKKEWKRTASLVGNKCRAERAHVLEIRDKIGHFVSDGVSIHDPSFIYKTGQEVCPDGYDDDICHECRTGIHFFMTREDAKGYRY